MRTIIDICNSIDLFGSYVTWRDWTIAIILIILILAVVCFGIKVFRRFVYPKTKANMLVSIIFIILMISGLIYASLPTSQYKRIQAELYQAEEYEEYGRYHDAYTIYINLKSQLGYYQDLDERIDRCRPNSLNE